MLTVAELALYVSKIDNRISEEKVLDLFLEAWLSGNKKVFSDPDDYDDYYGNSEVYILESRPFGTPGKTYPLCVNQTRRDFCSRLYSWGCLPRNPDLIVENHPLINHNGRSTNPLIEKTLESLKRGELSPDRYECVGQLVISVFLALRFLFQHDLPIPIKLRDKALRLLSSPTISKSKDEIAKAPPAQRPGRKKGIDSSRDLCVKYYDLLVAQLGIKPGIRHTPSIARLMLQMFPELSLLSNAAVEANIRAHNDEIARKSAPVGLQTTTPTSLPNPLK